MAVTNRRLVVLALGVVALAAVLVAVAVLSLALACATTAPIAEPLPQNL